jgi:hypothetical protein
MLRAQFPTRALCGEAEGSDEAQAPRRSPSECEHGSCLAGVRRRTLHAPVLRSATSRRLLSLNREPGLLRVAG